MRTFLIVAAVVLGVAAVVAFQRVSAARQPPRPAVPAWCRVQNPDPTQSYLLGSGGCP